MVDVSNVIFEKRRYSKLLLGIIFLILGIFLLIFPQSGLQFVAVLLGIVLLILAVVYGVQYLRYRPREKNKLLKALAALFFAILLFIFKSEVASVILPVIIGIGVIALAVICIITAIDYHKKKLEIWWLPFIGTMVSVIISILIFNNLQATSNIVAIIIGLFLVIFGALMLFEWVTVRSLLKKTY
ncbi:hypothetical protein SDC9_174975 [bioreactor metagenome]|uniref:Acid-resistance membrane protein n=1 Tax=bioreactor metagenome TaxID=1076179 RepID=A0A645GKQ6_9ZZZZ